MPIKFRCPKCEQFLGISRSKAGSLTDCPTCGRSIRVPNLDGSVQPLPKAELNLGDAELVNALDALARLDVAEGDEPGPPEMQSADSAAPVAVAAPKDVGPVPLPEPIALEPPLPVEAVAPKPAPVVSPPAPADDVDPLEQLAQVAVDTARPIAASSKRPTLWRPATLVALGAGGFLLFAVGFFIGRGSPGESDPLIDLAGDSAASAASLTPAADPSAGLPVEPTESFSPALTGRIIYVSADGVPRPDDGARVIVLPEQREGTTKLSVVGFRAGASSSDQQLARNFLRQLSGDYAIADSEGRYTIQLPAAGSYHVLLISRHQPRDDAEFPEPDLQRILSTYFDRPTSLIGSVRYDVSTFRYQGDEPSPRDHTFSR